MIKDNLPIKRLGDPGLVSGGTIVFAAGFRATFWHVHEIGLLGLVESGSIVLQTDGQSIIASAGMTIYVPPSVPHFESSTGSEVRISFVALPIERTKLMSSKIEILQTSFLLAALCRKIVSWGAITEALKTPAQRRLVSTFLDELAEADPVDQLTISYPVTDSLCRVADEIMSEPGDMHGIDYWAKKSGMSRRSFTKYFSVETGLSFAVWRQRVKLRKAMAELASGFSVSDVAFRLGYQDVSAFGAVFKKKVGKSPMQYKKIAGDAFAVPANYGKIHSPQVRKARG